MNPKKNTTRHIYRHHVNALLKQLAALRQHQNLLQAAGVRGHALTKLDQTRQQLQQELATTIAARTYHHRHTLSAT